MAKWLVIFSCGRRLPVEADTEAQAKIRAYVIERASAIVQVLPRVDG